jgi:hypothetical protein
MLTIGYQYCLETTNSVIESLNKSGNDLEARIEIIINSLARMSMVRDYLVSELTQVNQTHARFLWQGKRVFLPIEFDKRPTQPDKIFRHDVWHENRGYVLQQAQDYMNMQVIESRLSRTPGNDHLRRLLDRYIILQQNILKVSLQETCNWLNDTIKIVEGPDRTWQYLIDDSRCVTLNLIVSELELLEGYYKTTERNAVRDFMASKAELYRRAKFLAMVSKIFILTNGLYCNNWYDGIEYIRLQVVACPCANRNDCKTRLNEACEKLMDFMTALIKSGIEDDDRKVFAQHLTMFKQLYIKDYNDVKQCSITFGKVTAGCAPVSVSLFVIDKVIFNFNRSILATTCCGIGALLAVLTVGFACGALLNLWATYREKNNNQAFNNCIDCCLDILCDDMSEISSQDRSKTDELTNEPLAHVGDTPEEPSSSSEEVLDGQLNQL